MDYRSALKEAVQLVLAFDDLPEESVPEAVRSRAGLLAHVDPESARPVD